VSVTNGDGVAGNPTIDLDTTLFPSPLAGDAGKFLKAAGANATSWSSLGSSDITTALGFNPVNKAGDSLTTGTIALSGTAALTVQNPVNVLDAANKQYVDGFGQWTKSGSDIYRASGNVGIGTASPTLSKLQIVGQGDNTSALMITGSSTGTAMIDLRQDISNGTNTGAIKLYAGNPAVLGTYISGGTGNSYFNGGGNVGIGTTAPGTPLDIKQSTNGPTGGLRLTASGSVNDWNLHNNGAGEDFGITRNNGTPFLTILAANGNVGIGTTSPSQNLHIAGTSGAFALIDASGSSSALGNGEIVFKNDQGNLGDVGMMRSGLAAPYTNNLLIRNQYSSGDIVFVPGAAGASVVMKSSGNVGIGTTSPRGGLDVNSTILSKPATLNATGTIDFSTGNIQYTNNSCGAFQFNNVKDGTTYSFIVKGTTAQTCSFTAYSDVGTTALTVHLPPGHGATTTGKHTLYSVMIVGTDAYFSWIPGY
ncbi:MAG: hypothetical protein ACXVCE_08325, partial [Bacteriovorax sp.]